VSRLRRVAGPERVKRTDAGYQLSVDWLDFDALAASADEAERRLEQGAVVAARAAAATGLALVRGPLLADEADPWWAAPERAQAENLAERLRRAALTGAQIAHDWHDAAQQASAVLTIDPYNEFAAQALMSALTRTGRRASALARYAELRLRLSEDLGIDPSPETEQLHTSILLDELPTEGPVPRATGARQAPAGRATEFARLDELLAEIRNGCHVVMVEGDAGIGKSHLLRSWKASLDGGPDVVVAVACDELGQGLPLQPMFDVVNELTRHPAAGELGTVVGSDNPVLGPFLDIHWQPTDATQLAVLTDPGAGQALLFGALRNVIRRQAEHRCVVIILDDLHLADAATVRWLSQAPRHLADVRVLFVGATRREEGLTLPGTSVLALEPLAPEAASAIVGDDRAAELFERSGGNPLFLVELAAAEPGAALPDSIRHAVEERCNRAGAAAPTVRAAAVIGPEFDLELLGAATGLGIADLLDHLEEGVRRRFLIEVGAGFAFSHALVREALASGVGTARTAFIHRQSARALARRPDADPMVVARHARLGGEVADASAMLVAAARVAVTRFDHEEALRLVNEAIIVYPSADALIERARIHSMLGRYEEAARDIETARTEGGGAEALEVAAWSAHFQRQFGDAIALADRGVEAATTDDVRISCQSLGGWVALVSGNPDGAERRLEGAIGATPEPSGSMAQSWMAWLRVSQGRPDEALALVHPVEGHGLAAYRFPNAYALMAATMAHAMVGHPDDALRALDVLDADIARMGARRWVPRPKNLRGWIARNLGQPEEADELNLAAIETSQDQGMAEPRANGLLDLASGRLMQGDLDGVRTSLAQVEELTDVDHAFRWRHQLRARLLRARLELAGGEREAAAAHAHALAGAAVGLGLPRYEMQARLVGAVAEHQAGRMVDVEQVDVMLQRLGTLAGLEAWWITAELAQAFAVKRWDELARVRVAALVRRAGPYASSLEQAAGRILH
jgi:DNA-binding SARP family transcriptional activator/tetratricopeptide (TPR) repeat protein